MTERDRAVFPVNACVRWAVLPTSSAALRRSVWPDRIACMPNGETWFIELKKAGGRLSALQRIFADEMTHEAALRVLYGQWRMWTHG